MPPRRRVPRVHRALLTAAAAVLAAAALPATAASRLVFFGVVPDQSPEYRHADEALTRYLARELEVTVDRNEPNDYGAAIDAVTGRRGDDTPYLARLTPYACVAAQMLGARFDIIATYRSAATDRLTYNSYLVVPRARFASQPTIDQVLRGLAELDAPLFIYHDKFSTSSYFLPSIYFRRNSIYRMTERVERLTAIRVEQTCFTSSSCLVEKVARGEADLAAVWDGSMVKFLPGGDDPERVATGREVWFVKLPDLLPNDLLVAESSLDPKLKRAVRDAVRAMDRDPGRHVNIGDFLWWTDFHDAHAARDALGYLRKLALAPPSPVTVRVEAADGYDEDERLAELLEATRQAVRLSGTELTLHIEGFHSQEDMTWTLQPVHEGEAVVLRSRIALVQDLDQEFPVSFQRPEDLTQRVADLIRSRLHRIRYVWPYQDQYPAVLRDVDFAPRPAGGDERARVVVQPITWLDPERNQFQWGPPEWVDVVASDFYKFTLDSDEFPREADGRRLRFEPMANTAYRVVLVRDSGARPMFKYLSAALVALFALAGIGAVWDLRRRPR